MTKDPETILIYSGAERVGDGIYKLPFIQHIRARFPTAHLTWISGKGHTVYAKELAPLVSGLIDEVINEAELGRTWAEFKGPRPLNGRAFDLVVDTGRVVRTSFLVRRVRHKTFISAAAGWLLSDRWPRPLSRMAHKPPSVVGCLRELAEAITGTAMPPATTPKLDAATLAEARRLLPAGPSYLAFAPGSNDRNKCWPLDRFIQVAQWATVQGHVPVFLLGPNETEWADVVRSRLPKAVLPLQATTDVTPWLTIGLGLIMTAGITNDCGAAHMLAAADLPLVALFGPTRPEKFAPATTRLSVVKAQDFGDTKAMEAIPVDAAIRAVEGLLGILAQG